MTQQNPLGTGDEMMDAGNAPLHRIVRLGAFLLIAGGINLSVDCQAAPLVPFTAELVMAQVRLRGGMTKDELPQPEVFPRPERSLLRELSHARQLIDQRRYGEAVRCLDKILRLPEDHLYESDQSKSTDHSLQSEANHLLRYMPQEGRKLYELQYGPRARHLLNKAVEARDRDLLGEVSRRYFHTQAGYEATFLLGLHDYDHGEPLGAALTLEQLRDEALSVDRFEPALSLTLAACWRQAGKSDRAEDLLRDLHRRRPTMSIRIAGRERALPSDPGKVLRWLAVENDAISPEDERNQIQWTQPRGNAARNATTRVSRPLLEPVWQVPITNHPMAKSLLAGQSEYSTQRGIPIMPSLHPVALNGVVLMRSLRALTAIDSETGKRLWEVPADDVLAETPDAFRTLFPQPGQLAGLLCQRAWKDSIYGALSSDGQRVFAVEDLGINTNIQNRRPLIQGGHHVAKAIWPKDHNRLAAYDIHSGKLLWHLGGAKKDFGLDLSGAFFLGSPLVVADRLYQLAEIRSEIRLVALKASSGEVLWSQRIAMVDPSIMDNPIRRLAAVSPSYHNGILVCPTTGGAIVGLKLAQRSLLWGYRYASTSRLKRTAQLAMFRAVVRKKNKTEGSSHWMDGNLVLSDERILATPLDSDEIYCLGLLDGKLIWKKPRADGLYLAAVWNNNVVLVGTNRVWAVSLDDGKPAWDGRAIDLPEGSMPSGLGFHSSELYYLPLNSSELLVFDLDSGKIRQNITSPSGTVSGNLVCYRDKIISQNIHGITAFDQLEPLRDRTLRRLAANPDDADALRQKARILIDAGKRYEAIECLRHSYRLVSEKNCRKQLRNALLDGLRHDFERYQAADEEIERLLDTPAQRVEQLCLMAKGFQSLSAWKPALERYLRLADSLKEGRQLIPIDDHHMVRQDCWLASRLSRFRELAPANVVAELDQRLDRKLDAAMHDEKHERLNWFADCFDGQPQAAKARRELIRRYFASNELLKAERLLRRQMRSAKLPEAAAALIELADSLEKAKRYDDVAACYRELEQRWGNVICHEGKTGRQIVASLAADSPIAVRVHPELLWPDGAVKVTKKEDDSSKKSTPYSIAVEFRGTRRPFYTNHAAHMDHSGRKLTLKDGLGREQWNLAIEKFHPAVYSPYYSRSRDHRMNTRGHLMLLFTGEHRCVAIDTLNNREPRVLWDEDITNPKGHASGGSRLATQHRNAPWIPPMLVQHVSRSTRRAKNLPFEVLTDDYLCRQTFRRCIAVDPLTGKMLWSRSDVPARCIMLGDEKRILLVPLDQNEAAVLRAQDGERLSETRTVPDHREWIATRGCNILRWHLHNNKRTLEMFDPWERKTIWGPHDFSSTATYYLLDNEMVGIMEPGGRFAMFDLSNGEKRIDANLKPEAKLQEIILLDSAWGHILITNCRQGPRTSNERRWRPLYGVTSKTINKGRIYGFDRSGKPLWPNRPKGIPIEKRQLLLDQPAEVPVLAFAAQTYVSRARRLKWTTSLLVIDKRTGRELVDEEYDDRLRRMIFQGDPNTQTVQFSIPTGNLKLRFTNEPVAAEKAAKNASNGKKPIPGAKKSSTLEAILKSLRKLSRD